MANTGPFIYNVIEIENPIGTPISGSPFTVPLDATAQSLSELTGGVLSIDMAQSYIDNRRITDVNDPNVIACLPSCLTNLGVNEYPAEFVYDVVGESFHGQNDTGKVCMTFIL